MSKKKDQTQQDFWQQHKVGSRLMFLTVWFFFSLMAFKKIQEPVISKDFMAIMQELVIYLTLFVMVGANGLEMLGGVYEKLGMKKINKKEKKE